MKKFVYEIITNLVDHPEKVTVDVIGGTQTVIIEVSVDRADIGKVIGKRGKTINSIRSLLIAVASRNGVRVSLEILEDQEIKLNKRKEEVEAEDFHSCGCESIN